MSGLILYKDDFIGSFPLESLPSASLYPNKRALVNNYGNSVAISDGVRWRLERLYLPWGSLPPSSLVSIGTEASVTDVAGAIAVAGVTGWVFRPVEIFNTSTSVLISGAVGATDQVAYQWILPAGLLGVKGVVQIETFGTFSVASANSKTIKLKLGGAILSVFAYSSFHKTLSTLGRIKNINRTNQSAMDGGILGPGGSGGNLSIANVDTSLDAIMQITMALGSTAETCTFGGAKVTVFPSM